MVTRSIYQTANKFGYNLYPTYNKQKSNFKNNAFSGGEIFIFKSKILFIIVLREIWQSPMEKGS